MEALYHRLQSCSLVVQIVAWYNWVTIIRWRTCTTNLMGMNPTWTQAWLVTYSKKQDYLRINIWKVWEREGIIVDIASNDGTLLSGYKNENLVKVGIDPLMEIMNSYYPKNSIKIKKFFSASEYWKNCATGAIMGNVSWCV